MLDTLIGARLLAVYESDEGEPMVEMAHEALLRHWQQLQDWMGEDEEGQRMLRSLARAAGEWEGSGRHRDRLWTGDHATSLRIWLRKGEAEISPSEQAFATACQEALVRRRRIRRASVATAMLVLAVAGTVAVGLWRGAEAARQKAQTLEQRAALNLERSRAKELATRAELLSQSGKLATGARLVKEAAARHPEPSRMRNFVVRQLAGIRTSLVFDRGLDRGTGLTSWSRDGNRFLLIEGGAAHIRDGQGKLVGVAEGDVTWFSDVYWRPDGRGFATGGGSVRAFDGSGKLLGEQTDLPGFLWWSEDSEILLVNAFDADAEQGWLGLFNQRAQPIGSTPALEVGVQNFFGSPDGSLIYMSYEDDRPAEILDRRGELVRRLPIPDPGCEAAGAGWHPSSKFVAAQIYCPGRAVHSTRVVDITTAEVVEEAVMTNYAAWTTQFQPGGDAIVTSGLKGPAALYRDGQLVQLGEPCISETVVTYPWSPDGSYILRGCDDRLLVFDDRGEQIAERESRGGVLSALSWIGDRRAATLNAKSTVEVWDLDIDVALEAENSPVRQCAWSADGERLAAGTWMHSVRIWDGDGELLWHLPEATSSEFSTAMAWHPTDRRLAVLRPDELMVVEAGSVRTLGGPFSEPAPGAVAWRPDGAALAVAHPQRHALLDPLTMASAPLQGDSLRSGEMSYAAWSPDNSRFVAIVPHAGTRLWDQGGEVVADLRHNCGDGVAWHPSGERFVVTDGSAHADPKSTIFSADGEQLAQVSGLVFGGYNPSGDRMVLSSPQGTLLVDADLQTVVSLPEARQVHSVQWREDGAFFAMESDDEVQTYTASGEHWFDLPSVDEAFCWRPDGTLTLAGASGFRQWPMDEDLLLAELERIAPQPFTPQDSIRFLGAD